jgi:hypothetical protein
MRLLLRPLLRFLARLLFRVDVHFHHADFSYERLLVVANHESFLDGLLLGLFLPIDPVYRAYRDRQQSLVPPDFVAGGLSGGRSDQSDGDEEGDPLD